MKRRSLIICFVVIVIALGFFVCNSQAGEVWVGLGPTTSGFFRYDFGGTYIDKVDNSHDTTALAVVGDEAWVGLGPTTSGFLRYDFDGTYIDKINNSHYTTALAVVPEPSTVFLLALGAVMLRRKYQL